MPRLNLRVGVLLFAPLIAALALPLPAVAADPKDKDGEWVPLFNGKNLDGWTPKITGYDLGDNHADTVRVADAKKLIKDGKVLLEEGYISLQAESHPCEFRKVEVKVLKK